MLKADLIVFNLKSIIISMYVFISSNNFGSADSRSGLLTLVFFGLSFIN